MNAHPILLALGQIAAHDGTLPMEEHRFTTAGPWMLRTDQLPHLFAGAAIPGLLLKHRLAALANRKAQITLPVAAPAIQLKDDMTRIRAFAPRDTATPTGTSTKVVSAAAPIAAHTTNEIRIRTHLAALGTITVPRIIDSARTDEYVWVREELIRGRRFSLLRDARVYTAQGLPQLAATYKAHGLSTAPLCSFFPASLPNDMAALAARMPALHSLARTLDHAWQINANTPVSLCHGDLLPSNLAVSNGTLFFLDWELATEKSIISDLLRLPFKNARARRSLLAPTLDTLTRSLGVPTATVQQHLCAYICNRIVQRPAHARELLAAWQRYGQ